MPHVAARTASRDRDTGRYQSHRPEQTLLYQIVDEYYPAFAALMAEQGKELPGYVQRVHLGGFFAFVRLGYPQPFPGHFLRGFPF